MIFCAVTNIDCGETITEIKNRIVNRRKTFWQIDSSQSFATTEGLISNMS